jgi:hypothetical protein
MEKSKSCASSSVDDTTKGPVSRYDGWYADSPSHVQGVTDEMEHMHRVFGCELIQEACILMRLPQVVAATGQSILHRFYYRYGRCTVVTV